MTPHSQGIFHAPWIRRATASALLGAAALLVGLPGEAHPPSYADAPYSVTLQSDEGDALRTFRHEGTTYALAYLGERYDVRIDNHTGRRVEAVLTVDGRDAVSGSVGDFVHERGYLVPPHGSVTVNGFRRSLDETAAFRFSAPSSSYGARSGTPENLGVIGVAFFPERRASPRPVLPVRPWWESRHPSPAPPRQAGWADDEPRGRGRPSAPREALGGADDGESGGTAEAPSARRGSATVYGERRRGARSPDAWRAEDSRDADDSRNRKAREETASRLGTEYGEATWSRVTEVSFERENQRSPSTVVSLRYDDADGLLARGIDVYPRPYWAAPAPLLTPDPFPASRFALPSP